MNRAEEIRAMAELDAMQMVRKGKAFESKDQYLENNSEVVSKGIEKYGQEYLNHLIQLIQKEIDLRGPIEIEPKVKKTEYKKVIQPDVTLDELSFLEADRKKYQTLLSSYMLTGKGILLAEDETIEKIYNENKEKTIALVNSSGETFLNAFREYQEKGFETEEDQERLFSKLRADDDFNEFIFENSGGVNFMFENPHNINLYMYLLGLRMLKESPINSDECLIVTEKK